MLEHRRYLLLATYGLYVYEGGPTSALGWNLLVALGLVLLSYTGAGMAARWARRVLAQPPTSGLVLLHLVLLVALVLDHEPNYARMGLATTTSGAIVYTLLEPRQ